MSNHHAPDYLGEKCEGCGTVHRVLESLPDRPLSRSALDALVSSDGIEFAEGVYYHTGEMAAPNTEESTEDIVLSTSGSSMLVSRYAGTGWVVEQEAQHEPDESPEQVGQEFLMEASHSLSTAMQDIIDE